MARLTPSTRSSNITMTSGAHTVSVDIAAGAKWALIGFVYYNDTGPAATTDPTSVSLDGQAAVKINSAGTASTLYSALYKVSSFSTGASKTLAYTLSATGIYFGMNVAIEYGDGAPTYGANGAGQTAGGPPVTASTSSLANANGDLILSAYGVAHSGGTPSAFGSGQTALDETDDGSQAIYGFTTETMTGAGDVQSVTGKLPVIASTVVTVVAVIANQYPPRPRQFNRRASARFL